MLFESIAKQRWMMSGESVLRTLGCRPEALALTVDNHDSNDDKEDVNWRRTLIITIALHFNDSKFVELKKLDNNKERFCQIFLGQFSLNFEVKAEVSTRDSSG